MNDVQGRDPVPSVSESQDDRANRSRAQDSIRKIFDRLWNAYGPQHWWPAQTPAQVVIGAILTQNTSWTNVERAIENLHAAACLDWITLRESPVERVAELIRPAGTYRVKATRLKAFVDCLWKRHDGDLDDMLSGELEEVRRRLLSIHGIGPETADAILLYAGGRPSFVVDAYTKRILRRHLVIDARVSYEHVRLLFLRALPGDVQMFNEYHALLVTVGKRRCRTRAECDGCPLSDLPHDALL